MASSSSSSSLVKTYFDETVLPNYEAECMLLSVLLVLTVVFWAIVFPYTVSKFAVNSVQQDTPQANTKTSTVSTTTITTTTASKPQNGTVKQRKSGQHKKMITASANNNATKTISDTTTTSTTNANATADHHEPPSITLHVLAMAAMGLMVSTFYVVMTCSPYNTFVARGVFQVPMLTPDECETLVNMSLRVAQRNENTALQLQHASNTNSAGGGGTSLNNTMQGLLWEPAGWQKLRHKSYPTTDLNLVTDPFTTEDLTWLQEILDARLTPTLARIYGIPPSAIRANDIFVVRYDSEYRAHLSNHTDDSDISINILLTKDFEGGGTQFWNRQTRQPFAHVKPSQVGQMLTHSALINHEGMPTTNGTRIILVGFLSVDRIDPFSSSLPQDPKPKLNLFASWLSFPWITTKCKEAYVSADYRRLNNLAKWSNHKYAMALFLDLANVLQLVGDFFAPHHVELLVPHEHAQEHLQALDKAHQMTQQQQQQQQQQVSSSSSSPIQPQDERASWFKGQQINLDIDGTVTNEWRTREESKNRFMEL